MVAADDELLKIYLIEDDMRIGCPPLELTDELSKFCGIEKNEHIRLLTHILVQSDIRKIEVDLDRRDVPGLGPEFEEFNVVGVPNGRSNVTLT